MRNLNEVVNYRMLQMETTLAMTFIMSAFPAQSPIKKLNQVTQFMPTILNQLYSHFHGYFTMRLIPSSTKSSKTKSSMLLTWRLNFSFGNLI